MEEKLIIVGKSNGKGKSILLTLIWFVIISVLYCAIVIDTDMEDSIFVAIPMLLIISILFLVFMLNRRVEVTNKFIHISNFKNHIDLPIDQISYMSTIELFDILYIGTSSKRVKIFFLKNREEIRKALIEMK